MAAAFAAATGMGFNDGLTPAQRAAQRARLGISEEQARGSSLSRHKSSVAGSIGGLAGMTPEQAADRARRMQMARHGSAEHLIATQSAALHSYGLVPHCR